MRPRVTAVLTLTRPLLPAGRAMNATALSTAVGIGIQRSIQPGPWLRFTRNTPSLPVSGLVREKLNDHLSARALEGELEYFETAGGFERPYGYAWLLKLYAELRTWDDPDAPEWADNLEPLAALFSERMVAYLADLERPSRSGAHSNTSFALAMMLDYARNR